METKKNSLYGDRYIKFKSYYVVWKQAEGDGIFQGNILFKSYYVVWKHVIFRISHTRVKRLNRTM